MNDMVHWSLVLAAFIAGLFVPIFAVSVLKRKER